ncbi:MAG: 6-phosphogluconolactonase [Actinomycetota bacterium]|nr:6-phosphogluconolactonase [Actinomycetota bacterium]
MSEVVRFVDADALATDVAQRLLRTLAALQDGDRVPQVVLTGGTIADQLHREVARQSPGSGVDWRRVEVWWGDERFVAADDPDRNALQAHRALLDHVDVDPALVHEMPAAEGGLSVDEAADRYADEVRRRDAGSFDVVMLGMGGNGHVASLFPGRPQIDVDDRIAVAVTDSPKPPPVRISLTFGALNRTKQVWFLVTGEQKAEAVRRALAPEGDVHEIPARGITDSDATLWFLDEAAATGL